MSARFNVLPFRLAGLMFAAILVLTIVGKNCRAQNRQYVQISVVGKYNAVQGTITAVGKPKQVDAEFAVDFGRNPGLEDRAAELDGKTVSVYRPP